MSTYYVAGVPYSSELYHYGIKGQRWGIRRFQNPDGSLTAAGRQRYGSVSQSAEDVAKTLKEWARNPEGITEDSMNSFKPALRYASKRVRIEAKTYKDALEKSLAADVALEEYFQKNSDRFIKKYVSNKEMDEIRKDIGDDPQRVKRIASHHAEERFGDSNHPLAKAAREADKAYRESTKAFHEACNKYSREFLGEHGKEKAFDITDMHDVDYGRTIADLFSIGVWEKALDDVRGK